MVNCIGLIPARSGSKRVVDKNIKILCGKPLMAYTIKAALESKVFAKVLVSTDSLKYAGIAKEYGADVIMRPAAFATDISPDIEWVRHALNENIEYETFSILRPTSPFRTDETIRRAWSLFENNSRRIDSLRAVEKCYQHPGKMWVVASGVMNPIMPFYGPKAPWHSSPYCVLPEIWVQNASLEIAWSRVVFEGGTISGNVIMPFFTRGYEGFDINTKEDLEKAERHGFVAPPSTWN